MDRKAKGNLAEETAKMYYEQKNYELLERNYQHKREEVDLILLSPDDLLVFVEVKHRSRVDYGEAESFVSHAQQERIKSAAEEYIFSINWKKDIRFDIACVNAQQQVEVFEDAF